MYQLVTKLKRLKPVLAAINKSGFADIQGEEMRVKELMTECQRRLSLDPLNETLMQQEKGVREQYAEKHKALISFLQQKSKAIWIKNGDSNTSVFHSSIKDRSRQNRILSIVNAQGERVDEQEKITQAFLDYYKELLGTSMIGRKRVKNSVMKEGPLITPTQAATLMADFSNEEIKEAMFSIPGVKSPGPDGYGSYFFQDNWDLVGGETCEAIASFLKSEFGYHERSAEMKLNHLSFADDVLLFCRGDFKSVYLLMQGLKLFTNTSGLTPNKGKSAVFFSGMEENEIKRVLDMTGFLRQDAPFKYLGVPICARRIAASDCVTLAQKITKRIQVWATRNLSYAGRLVLVNSVLSTIHMYWSQIMVLPKKVIKEIEGICRSFLWTGKSLMEGAGAVGWEKLCYPKKEGGLGLLNIAQWNIAAMFKHIWAVANKKDNLWVKWVHCVYIKNHNWWEYKAPQGSSWYWRKLVSIKDLVKQSLNHEEFSNEEYKIAKGYRVLVQEHEKVDWCNEVWARINTPKHSFLTWLAIQQRLKTRDRLRCEFSQHCLVQVKKWLQWRTQADTLQAVLKTVRKAKQTKFRKNVKASSIAALVYLIWKARNELIWQKKVPKVEDLVQRLQQVVKNRTMLVLPQKVKIKDRDCSFLAFQMDQATIEPSSTIPTRPLCSRDSNQREKSDPTAAVAVHTAARFQQLCAN
uniref:Reverse transcriptase zinc-binding domain-containing protein n=1 Tax=Cannabis sativa TaxID=3483 RepID=A0A803PG06_CANSA